MSPGVAAKVVAAGEEHHERYGVGDAERAMRVLQLDKGVLVERAA